jgi:hypothetical protein
VLNQGAEGDLMKDEELLRGDPELRSDTPVVEPLLVECQQASRWLACCHRVAESAH